MKPLILLTDRLRLRATKNGDAMLLFHHYCSDKLSSKFLTRNPHNNIDQTEHFLKNWCTIPWHNESNQFGWVIALADSDEAIGIFLVELDAHKAQVHYGIARPFESQGFITEAGNAAVQWLLSQSELQRIWAVCDLENKSSIKVLEKMGFENEGILKKWLTLPSFDNHSARDCYIYALI